ncbi:MAG: hypothetical protein VKL00_11725 [Synechococcales bacterium]|nr:hypothetical protein [Cyanobacteria bacterium REEB444]MEB3126275.1 hypothetical protein [Synechococcales bacterium]
MLSKSNFTRDLLLEEFYSDRVLAQHYNFTNEEQGRPHQLRHQISQP